MHVLATKFAARCFAFAGVAVLLTLVVGATSRNSQAATTGLVAAYSFDEGSGTAVADASGGGNNGTVQNATWSTAGKYGGALSFNGTSSLVSIADNASLDFSSGMTLEAWVDPVTTSSWRSVIFKQSGPGMAYSLYASQGNGYSDGQVNIGGEQNAVDPWLTPTSSWTFFAVTYDGANLRLWANGVNVQTTAVAGSVPASTGPLTIGGNNVWPEWFQGLIDNVRLYNRALSQTEIQSDMNTAVVSSPAPAPAPAPAPSGQLVASYSFDEGTGASVGDASGNGNTGSVQGATWSTGGKYGGALSFNGTSSLVSIPDAPELDLTTGMTLEAWVKPTTVSTPAGLLFKQSGQGMAYGLFASDGAGFSSAQVNIGGLDKALDPWATPVGSWTFFAATYDGTNLRLWANGVNVQTMAVTGLIPTSNGSLTIGGDNVWTEFFSGLIDNVRVYSRALGQSEIQTDMNAAVTGGAAPPPPPGDTQAPTAPTNLTVTGTTQTGISVSWSASSDNVGVAGYGTYKNGASAGTSATTSYTYAGLACGTTYTLAVDAFDAAGNRSTKASVNAATSACPTGDTQAPTAPANLAITGTTQTSISVGWSASSDNVGVAGYGVYKNGASAGTSALTSYTFSGLACGTTYTLAVDAYDAAGNRSAKTSTGAATSACPVGSATVFIAPGGSDANPCTQSAPCASFDRAYHVAQPGQTVQVAGGTYGAQTVNPDASKSSTTDVFFRPAAGASVTVGFLDVYGSHMSFQDMKVNGGWQTYHGTDDVTFRNLTVNGEILTQSSSNISVIGGDVCCSVDTKSQFGNWPSGTDNVNILIDGVTFHDVARSSSAVHVECLLVTGVIGFTLRNSKFYNCDVFDISIGEMNGSDSPKNLTIENNFFGTANGYFSLDFNTNTRSLTNVTIRNNSATQEMYLGNAIGSISNMVATGNIAPLSPWNCDGRINYSWNVFQGGTCGPNDIDAAAGFRNAATLDLHLVAGAAAINHGNPTNFAPTDIDGQTRPLGGAPDAGADEAG